MPASTQVVSRLSGLPEDATVRVLIRGTKVQDAPAEPIPDPKDFSDGTAYRQALIRQRERSLRSSQAVIEQAARRIGLTAQPAQALNAVTVEGHPGQVLQLLEAVDIESAILDAPLRHAPLPKPR